jgi:hypothetical protein
MLATIVCATACGGPGSTGGGTGGTGLPAACCDRYNVCLYITPADCASQPGTYHAGETCTATLCGTPLGACCMAGGACNEMVTQSACAAKSGTWTSDDSCRDANCDDDDDNDTVQGACCDHYFDCTNATGNTCTNKIGGTWYSGSCATHKCGTETGACCLPGGGCDEAVTQSGCAAKSGVWTADNDCRSTTCPTWGACCNPFNVCYYDTASDCKSTHGGTWYSGTCSTHQCGAETGACCLPNNTCSEKMTQSNCYAQFGMWKFDAPCANTTCPSSWSWSQQASFGNGYGISFAGVWGSSATDVYVVGGATAASGHPGAGLIYHSNGSGVGSWKTELTTSDAEMFSGVWGSSATDVYAVSTTYDSNGRQADGAIWHYNGNSWTQVQLLFSNYLNAVWGSSSSDVFVVGSLLETDGTVAHWNGSAWSSMTVPSGIVTVNGVYGKNSTDVYASYVNNSGISGMMNYNGSSWSSIFERPNDTNDQELLGVWRSSTTVYTVGWEEINAEGPINPLIYEYINGAWPQLAPGTSDDSALYGLWGTADTNIWAVGNDNSTNAALLLRWNGGGWSPWSVSSPTTGLFAVWGSAPADVYAVGWVVEAQTSYGIILHYPTF